MQMKQKIGGNFVKTTQIQVRERMRAITMLLSCVFVLVFLLSGAAGIHFAKADEYIYTVTPKELTFSAQSAATGLEDVWESDNNWTLIRSKADANIAIVGNGGEGRALGIGYTMPEAGTVSANGDWDWYYYQQNKNTTVYSQVFLNNTLVYPSGGRQFIKSERPAVDAGYAPSYLTMGAVNVAADDLLLFTMDSMVTGSNVDSVAFDYVVKFVPTNTESALYNDGAGVVWKFSELYYTTDTTNADLLKFYQVKIDTTIIKDEPDDGDDSDKIIETGTYYDVEKTPLVFREVNNNTNVTNCWEGANNWTLIQGANLGITGHASVGYALALEFTFSEAGSVSKDGDWNFYVWNKGTGANPYLLMLHNGLEIETTLASSAGDGALNYYVFDSFDVEAGDTVTFIMDADSVEDMNTNISVQYLFVVNFVPDDTASADYNDGEGVKYNSETLYYTTDTTNSSILKYYEVSYVLDETNGEGIRYNPIAELDSLTAVGEITQGVLYHDGSKWAADEENYCFIYNNSMHPAVAHYPTVVFKAPDDGKIFFTKVSYQVTNAQSDGVNFGVFANVDGSNYSLIENATWNETTAKESVTLNLPSLELNADDEIYFVLHPYKSNSYDSCNVTIELVYKVGDVEKKYSLSEDYSNKQGKNNFEYRWSQVALDYNDIVVGEAVDRTFTEVEYLKTEELVFSETQNRWFSLNYEFSMIEPASMHPVIGTDLAAAVKFEKAGRICFDESASVQMTQYGYTDNQGDTSDGVRFRIMLNDKIIFPASGEWKTIKDNNEVALTMEPISVKAGDVLYFVINCNVTMNYDTLNTNLIVHFAEDGSDYTKTYSIANDFSGTQGENDWYYYEISFEKPVTPDPGPSDGDDDPIIVNPEKPGKSCKNAVSAESGGFAVALMLLFAGVILFKKRQGRDC